MQQQQILSLEICQKIAEKLVRSLQILSILTKFDQIARPLSGKWVWQSQDKVSSAVLGPSWMISFDKRGRHLEDKWCGFRSCHHVVYFTDFWKLSQNDQWFWSHCLNRAIFFVKYCVLIIASLQERQIFENLLSDCWRTVTGKTSCRFILNCSDLLIHEIQRLGNFLFLNARPRAHF